MCIAWVNLQLRTDTEEVLEFTAPAYVADSGTRIPYMFAPTIRLVAGDPWSLKLTNGLLQPSSDTYNSSAWGFQGPMHTNLHRHGLHADTGELVHHAFVTGHCWWTAL